MHKDYLKTSSQYLHYSAATVMNSATNVKRDGQRWSEMVRHAQTADVAVYSEALLLSQYNILIQRFLEWIDIDVLTFFCEHLLLATFIIEQ